MHIKKEHDKEVEGLNNQIPIAYTTEHCLYLIVVY